MLTLLIVTSLWALREWQIYASTMRLMNVGPDVIVGEIPSIYRWGSQGSETSFSIGTTSCNIGDARLDWISNSNIHPVISQNLYRVKNGRIEQIGMSWLKHGFAVAAGSACGTCTDPSSVYLGVGCSDPYGATLNGSQSRLGPRNEVNATTGIFAWPHSNLPQTGTLDGRIRVLNSDLDTAQNAGARYFVESQYVHPQDAMSGNDDNNASYREAFVTAVGSGWDLNTGGAPTVREQAAIYAWQAVHSDVEIFVVDVPDDGRILVGMRVSEPSPGVFHTEIAIENLNSHQSVGSLGVKFGSDVISNPGFNDVDYQFEPYTGTDWIPVISGNELVWSTETFSANQNANAIRWNTLYSYWCDSARPPRSLTLGMFRPGTVGEMTIDLADIAVADSMKLLDGVQVGGQLSDISASNDQYLELDPTPTKNLRKQKIDVILQSVSPTAAPADLAIRLEAAMSGGPSGDVVQFIQMLNYDTGRFEMLDMRPVLDTEEAVEISPTGDLGRFVRTGTNEITARITWNSERGFTGQGFVWSIDIDEAVWVIAE
jgi:hypothetical protein